VTDTSQVIYPIILTDTAQNVLHGLGFDFRSKDKNGDFYVLGNLKQNVSIAKSPTRTLKTQTNHIYCAICAYIKLEKLKLKTRLNHFEIKNKIYIKALKSAYAELANINAQTMPA
jgi:poly-D-alanine transfer protein DltD